MFVIRHIESNDFYKNYLSLISELSPVLSTHYSFLINIFKILLIILITLYMLST